MWALQRCAKTQDLDSPCDILGKSLLPAASVFPFVKWVCWTQLGFQCLVCCARSVGQNSIRRLCLHAFGDCWAVTS